MNSTSPPKELRLPPHDPHTQPFMVFWELTRACDLACQHCRAESIPDRHPSEIKGSDAIRLLDDLATVRPLLILTGGDCFKRDDLEWIVEKAVERKIPVAISPSATPGVTRERLKNLKNLGVRAASLSLDGATAKTHDAFRRVSGAFDLTLNIWDMMLDLGYKIQINTTVTRFNVRELPDIAHLIIQRKVMTWSVFFLVKTGRARELQDLTAEEYEHVMHWLYDIGQWIPTKTTEGHHFKRVVVQRNARSQNQSWRSLLPDGHLYDDLMNRWLSLQPGEPETRFIRPPMHLNVGYGILFIDHLGYVYPGGFLPIPCGNVREKSPIDIYRYHPLFRRLRDPDSWPGRCGQCEFRFICGGSRSRAYALTGSPFADDPRCIHEPTPTCPPFPEAKP